MSTPQWLRRAMVDPVEVFDRVAVGLDEYGNTTYEDVLVWEGSGLLQPLNANDLQRGRAGVGSFLLFLPSEAAPAVTTFSRAAVDTVSYEAEGPPAVQRELFSTAVHHVEMNLVRSTS